MKTSCAVSGSLGLVRDVRNHHGMPPTLSPLSYYYYITVIVVCAVPVRVPVCPVSALGLISGPWAALGHPEVLLLLCTTSGQ